MPTPFGFSLSYLKEVYTTYVSPAYENYFSDDRFPLWKFVELFITSRSFKKDRIYFEELSPINLCADFESDGSPCTDPIPHEFEERDLNIKEVEDLLSWFIYQTEDKDLQTLNAKSWSLGVALFNKFLGNTVKLSNGTEVKVSKLFYTGWECFDKNGHSLLNKYLQYKNKKGKLVPYDGSFGDQTNWKMYFQLNPDIQLSNRASELCDELRTLFVELQAKRKKIHTRKLYALMFGIFDLGMQEGRRFDTVKIKAYAEKLTSQFFSL